MLLELFSFFTGKSLIKSASECADAYATLEKVLLEQGVKDATFLFNEPIATNSFSIEVSPVGVYGNYFEHSLDFDYDELENVCWINFIYDLKRQELNDFLNGLKEDKVCIFNNEIHDNNLYVGEYPHLMITIPYGEKIRFIMFECEDCASDELVLSDVLVNKTVLIKAFEQANKELKNKDNSK